MEIVAKEGNGNPLAYPVVLALSNERFEIQKPQFIQQFSNVNLLFVIEAATLVSLVYEVNFCLL